LVVLLVEFTGAVDEYQGRARPEAPHRFNAIATARGLRAKPFRQDTLALINRSSAARLVLFIEWERCKEFVDASDRLSAQRAPRAQLLAG
jgi:hypothetical protein